MNPRDALNLATAGPLTSLVRSLTAARDVLEAAASASARLQELQDSYSKLLKTAGVA
jgi:hypothetical protein